MLSDYFYSLDNDLIPYGGIANDTAKRKEILTLLVDPDSMKSVRHKLARIKKQEEFKRIYQAKYDLLTIREREVLTLLARGLNNPKIAEELYISRKTVEQHRKNLNRKLEIKSSADLMRYALAFDLV